MAEAGEWKEGADWDGLGDGSEGEGGAEVNSRISRPGFRTKGGVSNSSRQVQEAVGLQKEWGAPLGCLDIEVLGPWLPCALSCRLGWDSPVQMHGYACLGLGVQRTRDPDLGLSAESCGQGGREVKLSHDSSLFPGKLSSRPGKLITTCVLRTLACREQSVHQPFPEKMCHSEARAVPTTVFQAGGSSGQGPGQAVPLSA